RHAQAARRGARSAPARRALLVGIAEYADPANRLDGPVNDVFRVSASLQELGFPADGIRVVLNDRATAAGIRERLAWLLGDARPGDQLVFYFAGHGAQVPGYGRDAEVDRVDECLVPHDFDWSAGRAITDDEFAGLYSQLPYETGFTAILDCCHSGGMARAAGARARGLAPPDDIRHRMLRWDRATQMWLPRARLDATAADTRAAGPLRRAADREAWTGRSGSVRRLGRATSLWSASDRAYRAACAKGDHCGPYTPILLEACREGELAYEYRHGVTAHGAFTYALTEVLRAAAQSARPRLTFEQLIAETARRVASVVAEPQHPQLHCPAHRRKDVLPGIGPAR
ncbi:MAG: caspase family protein, partial [Burkholderiales bacterium]|nr:caspase family protein [Burkholderiales bacterium]